MNEELNREIEKIFKIQNQIGIDDFEGYSPLEMRFILYELFHEDSPVQLVKPDNSEFQNIPIQNQIRFLLELIKESGELKLTSKGFLPTKIVAEIYNQRFIKEYQFESGISKLYKEIDSQTIHLTRILTEISGLVKKRNGKISLTKKGEKSLIDNYYLFRQIFINFGTRFNWAYFDGYGDNKIGQLGFGFSLILLSKYGDSKQLDSFYAEKYFKAFPQFIRDIEEPRYTTKEKHVTRCYSIRTFERFLEYFGVIEIEKTKDRSGDNFIKKTDLFDRLISVRHTTSAIRHAGGLN